MPNFELVGTAVNGRRDVLKLPALNQEEAIAAANKLGFKVEAVRDPVVASATYDADDQQLAAMEALANSPLIRSPIWTIFISLVLAFLVCGVIYFLVTLPGRLDRSRQQEAFLDAIRGR